MGKKMSDTSPEDMDRLVGESLLFYSQDNESIELSLTFTQTAVIQDVLGIKERDEKVCMYDDGHLEKVLGDADYLHKVRLGVGSDDSPFGVFSKSECVFLLEGRWRRIPLSDVQVSVLVKTLGLRTDGKSVEGMSDEELLLDYLPDKWSDVQRELLEIKRKLVAVRQRMYVIWFINGVVTSIKQRRCRTNLHNSILMAEKDVEFADKRVKDMIKYVVRGRR